MTINRSSKRSLINSKNKNKIFLKVLSKLRLKIKFGPLIERNFEC